MVDEDTLATVGSVVVGFGIAAFVFRLQRELQMIEKNTAYWIPWADRLLVGIVTAGLLLILFPIALAGDASVFWG